MSPYIHKAQPWLDASIVYREISSRRVAISREYQSKGGEEAHVYVHCRVVWGYAPPGEFWFLGIIRWHLRPLVTSFDAYKID